MSIKGQLIYSGSLTPRQNIFIHWAVVNGGLFCVFSSNDRKKIYSIYPLRLGEVLQQVNEDVTLLKAPKVM